MEHSVLVPKAHLILLRYIVSELALHRVLSIN